MRLLNSSLIKISLGFIVGIFIGFYFETTLKVILISIGLHLISLIISYSHSHRLLFLYLSISLSISLGILGSYIHTPQNQENHICHIKDAFHDKIIQGEITEILRANDYNQKYIIDNISVDQKPYNGKILWNISKDSIPLNLEVGQYVVLSTSLKDFNKAKNPQSFDYAAFMHNRNVYKVIYEDHFIILPKAENGIKTFGAKQRLRIVNALRKSGFEEKHLQLIQALILGQKQTISKEVYQNFADVGVVHILAVSGLHVGIILIILRFLLSPLLRIPKLGRKSYIILCILGLWAFAALAGFSPSVLRAATMFSFLSLGQLNKRKTNSLNLLFLSAFVLLLFNPQLIFEVGFQLSYAAVFSIVMLYPQFSKWFMPKQKIIKIFIDTAYLSLAAQVGVLPFQLFYFHQFPSLFLIGNLVIIPFLFILLSGGIISIVLSLLGIAFKPIVTIYSILLDLLSGFVDWLSGFNDFVIQEIFLTKWMFISLMVLVFYFILMIRDYGKRNIALFLLSSLAFIFISIYEIEKKDQKSELIVFYKSKYSIIGIKHQRSLTIYADTTKINSDDYWLKNYVLLNRIEHIELEPSKNAFKINHENLLVIDSTKIYDESLKADYLLLTNSPDLHFEKLIKAITPKQIIADGQNYKSYVERWEQTCHSKGIPFHNIYDDGYFSLSLD